MAQWDLRVGGTRRLPYCCLVTSWKLSCTSGPSSILSPKCGRLSTGIMGLEQCHTVPSATKMKWSKPRGHVSQRISQSNSFCVTMWGQSVYVTIWGQSVSLMSRNGISMFSLHLPVPLLLSSFLFFTSLAYNHYLPYLPSSF